MPEVRTASQWFVYVDKLLYKFEQTKSPEILLKIYKACGSDALKIFAPGRSFSPEQLKQFPAVEIAKSVEIGRVSEIVRVLYNYIDSLPYDKSKEEK